MTQETIDILTRRLNDFAHLYNPLHIRARLKDILPENIYRANLSQYITLYEEQIYKPSIKMIQSKIANEIKIVNEAKKGYKE